MKTPHQKSLIFSALLLGMVGLAYALSEEFTGKNVPTAYVTADLARARAEVEELERAFRNRHLSPREFMQEIHRIAASNKQVTQEKSSAESDHVIDISGLTLPTSRPNPK